MRERADIVRAVEEKTNEVLSSVVNFINEYEYPPSMVEIANMTGLVAKSHVNWYLGKLEKEGSIKRDFVKGRAMRVTLYPSPIEFPEKYNRLPQHPEALQNGVDTKSSVEEKSTPHDHISKK